VREVTRNEFFVFIGILIVSGAQTGGRNLYQSVHQCYKNGCRKVLTELNMSKYMTKTRFEEIRGKFDFAFEDQTLQIR
jgi:hypothetical protein